MFKMFLSKISLLILISATFPALAKTAPPAVKDVKMASPEPYSDTYTEEQFTDMAKHYKSSASRKTASTDYLDENTILSKQYMNIRNAIIGGPKYENGGVAGQQKPINSAMQLHGLLEDLDKKF